MELEGPDADLLVDAVAAQLGTASLDEPLGCVRVLVVEDDAAQVNALGAMFDLANQKNGGTVTFDITGVSSCPQTNLSARVHRAED